MRITIPEDMKYFCVIETIALYIQKYVQYRKRKVFFGTTGKIDSLIPTMLKHKGEKYLVPQSSVHNDSISALLDANKLKHKECVMYRTVSNGLTDEEVKNFDYDMLIFFSPTRELCLQIADDLKEFSKYIPHLHIAAVYGGASIDTQIRQLRHGVQIIVTQIHAQVEGDTYFPEDFDLTAFETVASKSYSKDEKNVYDFTIEYRKRKEV